MSIDFLKFYLIVGGLLNFFLQFLLFNQFSDKALDTIEVSLAIVQDHLQYHRLGRRQLERVSPGVEDLHELQDNRTKEV